MSKDRLDNTKIGMLRADIRALARGLATEASGQNRPQQIRRLRGKLAVAKKKLSYELENGEANIVTSPLPSEQTDGIESL